MPTQVISNLRDYVAKGEWHAYWASFSEVGKGWFVREAALAVALDAYDQPVHPDRGEDSRRFLDKYEVGKKQLQRNADESSEDTNRRIARKLGDRGPKFCEELFSKLGFSAFPEQGEPRVLKQEDNWTLIQLPSGIHCALSKVGGRWYLDGPPSN